MNKIIQQQRRQVPALFLPKGEAGTYKENVNVNSGAFEEKAQTVSTSPSSDKLVELSEKQLAVLSNIEKIQASIVAALSTKAVDTQTDKPVSTPFKMPIQKSTMAGVGMKDSFTYSIEKMLSSPLTGGEFSLLDFFRSNGNKNTKNTKNTTNEKTDTPKAKMSNPFSFASQEDANEQIRREEYQTSILEKIEVNTRKDGSKASTEESPLAGLFATLKGFAGSIKSIIGSLLSTIGKSLMTIGKLLLQGIMRMAPQLLTKWLPLAAILASVGNGIKEAWEEYMKNGLSLEVLNKLGEGILDVLLFPIHWLTKTLGEILGIDVMTKFADDWLTTKGIQKQFSDFGDWLATQWQDFWGNTKELISNIFNFDNLKGLITGEKSLSDILTVKRKQISEQKEEFNTGATRESKDYSSLMAAKREQLASSGIVDRQEQNRILTDQGYKIFGYVPDLSVDNTLKGASINRATNLERLSVDTQPRANGGASVQQVIAPNNSTVNNTIIPPAILNPRNMEPSLYGTFIAP